MNIIGSERDMYVQEKISEGQMHMHARDFTAVRMH